MSSTSSCPDRYCFSKMSFSPTYDAIMRRICDAAAAARATSHVADRGGGGEGEHAFLLLPQEQPETEVRSPGVVRDAREVLRALRTKCSTQHTRTPRRATASDRQLLLVRANVNPSTAAVPTRDTRLPVPTRTCFSSAAMSFSGMPHRPKPPTRLRAASPARRIIAPVMPHPPRSRTSSSRP